MGASPLPSRGPKKGRTCYVTPAFWGVPNAKRVEKIRHGYLAFFLGYTHADTNKKIHIVYTFLVSSESLARHSEKNDIFFIFCFTLA